MCVPVAAGGEIHKQRFWKPFEGGYTQVCSPLRGLCSLHRGLQSPGVDSIESPNIFTMIKKLKTFPW